MASEPGHVVRAQLQALFSSGSAAGISDRQLLEAFAQRRGDAGEAAFEALVRRHGPMVLRVCRRVLGNAHDVEDAFQATFLVLACRADAIRRSDSLGCWLFGVARRISSKARATSSRRRTRERSRAEMTPVAVEDRRDEPWTELYEEIDSLPEKYRVPIVLCYLEGLGAEEAAGRLRWPVGTVHSRLSRARERLRSRLVRRGLTLPAASAVVLGLSENAPATPTEALVGSMAVIAKGMTVGTPNVATLAKSVLRSMVLTRLKAAALGLVTIATVALGAGFGAGKLLAQAPASRATTNPPPRTEKTGQNNSRPEKEQADADRSTTAAKKPGATRTPSRGRDDLRLLPITISGRAIDDSGKLIAGASIYVTDANDRQRGGSRSLLGTAVTGPDGRYELRDLELPVWRIPADPLPTVEQGRFQLSGTAPGFGITWREIRSHRPSSRPAKVDPDDAQSVSFEGEPIALDLTFGPPASLQGRVTDDQGKPVAGAKVQVGYIDDVRRANGRGMWHCTLIDPRGGEGKGFTGISSIPDALRTARTGVDGSYRIDGLPREAELLAQFDYGPAYDPFSLSIATTVTPHQGIRSLGHDGALDHTFVVPRTVRVRMTLADTKGPAVGVTVRARGDRIRRAGAVETTNERGEATLRLPPGPYTLIVEPPFGMAYLPAAHPATVAKDPLEQAVEIGVEPGVAVVVEAGDSDDGSPVAGVGIAYVTETSTTPRELQSHPAYVDHPTTDRDGLLRAVVAPGRRQFRVADVPPGYEPTQQTSAMLDLLPGSTAKFRVVLKKKPEQDTLAGPLGAGGDDALKRLGKAWQHQRQLTERCTFKARCYNQPAESISPSELLRLLQSLDSDTTPDLLALLKKRFPEAPDGGGGFGALEVVQDGHRRRETVANLAANGDEVGLAIHVNNGWETYDYSRENAQVDIYDPYRTSVAVSSLADYVYWPSASDFAVRKSRVGNSKERRIAVERAGGRPSGWKPRLTRPRSSPAKQADSSTDIRNRFTDRAVSAGSSRPGRPGRG